MRSTRLFLAALLSLGLTLTTGCDSADMPTAPNETLRGPSPLSLQMSTPACVLAPEGLVSWWPGDGDADDIANSNDGTLQGGATFAAGMVGQAFSFDGVDDYVSIPFKPNFNFDPAGQFTIDAWVNPGRVNAVQALVIRDVFQWDWGLWLFGPRFLTGHHNRNLLGSMLAQTGTWIHVAVTYDNGSHALYVNGVLDNLSGLQSPITQSNAGLALGRRVGVYYQGLLDEVELFNRALSQAEIQAIFEAGSAGKCKTISVGVDIKPGSLPNSINTKSRGVVPVALLGSPDFDVTGVDVTTLAFGPAGATPAHDLTDPVTYTDHLQDVNGDGFVDLASHYRQKEMGLALGDTEACLTGATNGGVPIEGCDSVNIVR